MFEICEGCLGFISTDGNITDQETLVIFPTSSPLMKFAIRPKNIPIGATHAITSNSNNELKFFFFEKKYVAAIIPINAP